MAKKSKDTGAEQGDPNARIVTTDNSKQTASEWFSRARDAGDKRRYDQAIDYYITGLEFWPDAVEEGLKPLHGCGVARRTGGGSKPGFKDTMRRSMSDKDATKAFSNALWLFSHDPNNLSYIEGIVKSASRIRAEDAALWAGRTLQKSLQGNAKTTSKQLLGLASAMEEVGDRAGERDETSFALEAYQVGMDAYNLLKRTNPKDQQVDHLLKALATKFTILKGKFQTAESFTESIADAEQQADLHDQDRSVQSEDRVDQLIMKAKQAWEAEPTDPIAIKNYVDILTKRERDEQETVAIGVCVKSFKATSDYRWKVRAEDIRMKQLSREARRIAESGDKDALRAHRQKQLVFELGVYKERESTYPTDKRIKYDYAIRLYTAGKYDDAIPMFQTARADPKNRSACGVYLGRCFYRKKFYPQAISTLEEALEHHEFDDDELALEMNYWLGRSQEDAGNVDAARQTYGKILQLDYNYRDVRVRLEGLAA